MFSVAGRLSIFLISIFWHRRTTSVAVGQHVSAHEALGSCSVPATNIVAMSVSVLRDRWKHHGLRLSGLYALTIFRRDKGSIEFNAKDSDPYKNAPPRVVPRTDWHLVVAFRGMAESAKLLAKSTYVEVGGQLQSREYMSDETRRRVSEVWPERSQA